MVLLSHPSTHGTAPKSGWGLPSLEGDGDRRKSLRGGMSHPRTAGGDGAHTYSECESNVGP